MRILDWLYDPREGDLPEPRRPPFVLAVHESEPEVTARIDYDQALNARRITLDAGTDGPPLTRRLMRDYPIGAIDTAARTHMARWWREFDSGRSEAARSAYPVSPSAVAIDMRRPGRRGRPDVFYAELAAEYVAWLESPDDQTLTEFAQTRFVSESQMRNLLHEARYRKLLSKSPPGKAGGHLTERAIALLVEAPAPSSWTADQLAEARKRDQPFRDLAGRLERGEIDAPQYGRELDRLMTETFGDSSSFITVNKPQKED